MPVNGDSTPVIEGVSNRAPFVVNALTDNAFAQLNDGNGHGLLASNASKKLFVYDTSSREAALGFQVTIWNQSGQDADVVLSILVGSDPQHQGNLEDTQAIRIPATIPPARVTFPFTGVVAIKETNVGPGTQTGAGVQYEVMLAPRRRGA